jgi:hypothetical protein
MSELRLPANREVPLPTSLASRRSLPLLVDLCLIAIAAVIFSLPMLIYGPMVQGHDTYEHLYYAKYFTEQFWSGDWYPRWLIDMNHGLGSPTFFVFPPLPSFATAVLTPAAAAFGLSAFRIAELLCLLASGICAYLWLTTMAVRWIAVAAAVLYMLIPYHLAIDFYRRAALPESWALAWMPLVLYFTSQLVNGKRRAVVGVAVAYSLLIVSHMITVFMFSLVPLSMAAVFSPAGRKWKTTLQTAGGMGLGAGLSAVYLLPALLHSRNFPALRVIQQQRFDLPANLVGRHFFQSGDEFFRTGSWFLAGMGALLAICSAAVLLVDDRPNPKGIIAFWLAVCALPVFLMTKLSLPIWTLVPPLSEAVQYPWRFNVVVCVAVLPILAAFLSSLARPHPARLILLPLAFAVVATWFVSYSSIWWLYKAGTAGARDLAVAEDAPRMRNEPVNTFDGWFAAWPVSGLDQTSALTASAGPKARFSAGVGEVTASIWKPREIELHVSSAEGGLVVVNQFYYPFWTATATEGTRPIDIQPAMPQGTIALRAPAGRSTILLRLPKGAAERVGNWLSVISAIICAVLLKTTAGG